MARWLVELNGEAFDVDEFPFWFPSGNVFAIAENGKVFLTGTTFEEHTEPIQVHEASTRVVDQYFAIIVLLQSGLQKPSINVVFREADDGTRKGFAFLTGVAGGRSKARALSTTEENGALARPTQAQELLIASRTDRRLQVAVSLLSSPEASWPHLYRCLEEVEYFLGKQVSEAGLCSDNQRERFTRTANAAEASGTDARHRFGKFVPPSDPMSLQEARTFLSQILQSALRNVFKAIPG